MPNWTRTTYVFAAHQESSVKDFHDKLLKWTSAVSLCPDAWEGNALWLGNILVNAGIDLAKVDDTLRYRGTLDEVGEIEHGKLNTSDLEEYHYFTAVTNTAWVEMPKMWRFVLDKLYGNLNGAERIDFAFLAEEETHCYVHAYNPMYLTLLGVAENEKYSCLKYIGEDFSKELASEIDEYEVTAGRVAMLLSEILSKHITECDVENVALLEQLLDKSNSKLEAVNKDYFIEVVPITVVSEEEFE